MGSYTKKISFAVIMIALITICLAPCSFAWSNANDLLNYAEQNWVSPVDRNYYTSAGSGGFGSPRGGGARAHAAVDFMMTMSGTSCYAMTSGRVVEIERNFYEDLDAVHIKNDDGSEIRYGEIKASVSEGQTIRAGDVIGTIRYNSDGTQMLHLELYLGVGSGSLTDKNNSSNYPYCTPKNYQRRYDLVDSTKLLGITRTSSTPALFTR